MFVVVGGLVGCVWKIIKFEREKNEKSSDQNTMNVPSLKSRGEEWVREEDLFIVKIVKD